MADGHGDKKWMVATLERPTPATPTTWRARCSTCGPQPWRRSFFEAMEDRYSHRDAVVCVGHIALEGAK